MQLNQQMRLFDLCTTNGVLNRRIVQCRFIVLMLSVPSIASIASVYFFV